MTFNSKPINKIIASGEGSEIFYKDDMVYFMDKGVRREVSLLIYLEECCKKVFAKKLIDYQVLFKHIQETGKYQTLHCRNICGVYTDIVIREDSDFECVQRSYFLRLLNVAKEFVVGGIGNHLFPPVFMVDSSVDLVARRVPESFYNTRKRWIVLNEDILEEAKEVPTGIRYDTKVAGFLGVLYSNFVKWKKLAKRVQALITADQTEDVTDHQWRCYRLFQILNKKMEGVKYD